MEIVFRGFQAGSRTRFLKYGSWFARRAMCFPVPLQTASFHLISKADFVRGRQKGSAQTGTNLTGFGDR